MLSKHFELKKFHLIFLLLMLGVFLSSTSKAASLTAHVDNNIVQIGQFIQFSVTLSDKSSSQKPDFSALQQDFDLLSGISTSSQTQIINGSMSTSTTWTITISPKQEGAIVIPPIKLAGLETEAITIVVGKAPQKEFSDVFIETTLSKKQAYVQEQIKLDLKLYIRMADLSSTQLDDLNINDAKVLPAGETKQSQILKNGIRYHLVERSYFIFPEKSGLLKIPSLRFNGVINEGSRYSRFGTQRRITASSDAFDVKIKPIPESFPKNANWLPAEQVLLAETFSPGDSAKLGDPITRTIVTKATGLSASALPPVELKAIDGLKIYPDEGASNETISANSLVSTRNDSFALIASKSGDIELPAYRLPWWDTRNDKLRYSELDGKTLHFTASLEQIISTQDNFNEAGNDDLNKKQDSQVIDNKIIWLIVSGFLILWLTTIFAFIFYIRKLKKNVQHEYEKESGSKNTLQLSESEKSALNEFEQACKNNNTHMARTSLIHWARLHFPDKNIEGLSKLAHVMENTNGQESTALLEQLCALDKHIYTNENAHMDLSELRRLMNEWIKGLNKKIEKSEKGKKLSELYDTTK